jgi:hypothetical protein
VAIRTGVPLHNETLYYATEHLFSHLFTIGDRWRSVTLLSKGWVPPYLVQEGQHVEFTAQAHLALETTRNVQEPGITHQIRSSLIRSSVKSFAMTIPPVLYPVLIQDGVWRFSTAISYAEEIPNHKQRCSTLISIARSTALASEKEHVLAHALRTEWPYSRDLYRELLLRTVSTYLPIELLPTAINLAGEISVSALQQGALSALLHILPPHQFGSTLAQCIVLARSSQNPLYRAETFSNLGPWVTPDLVVEALEQIALVKDDPGPYEFLLKMAGYLPSELKDRVVSIMEHVPNPGVQVLVLVAFASRSILRRSTLLDEAGLYPAGPAEILPVISSELMLQTIAQARQIADKIGDELVRARALMAVSALLPEIQGEVVALIISLGRTREIALMDFFLKHLQPELRDHIADSARSFIFSRDRMRIMRCLAPLLSQQRLIQLLGAADLLNGRTTKLEALGTLLTYLPTAVRREQLQRLLSLASEIQDRPYFEALIEKLEQRTSGESARQRVGFHLNSHKLSSVVILHQIRNTIAYKFASLNTWSVSGDTAQLIAQLESRELEILFDFIEKRRNAVVDALVAVFIIRTIRKVPDNLLSQVVDHVLSRLIDPDISRATQQVYLCALADVADRLSVPLLERVFHTVAQVKNRPKRICIYLLLALSAPQDVVARCREEIAALPVQVDLESVLCLITPEHEKTNRLTNVAWGVSNDWLRQSFFFARLPHLPDTNPVDEASQALASMREDLPIVSIVTKHALMRLASSVPLSMLRALLLILDEDSEELGDVRPDVLAVIASRLMAFPQDELYTQWNIVLDALSSSCRSTLLASLLAFDMVIDKLGGKQALQEVQSAAADIVSLWP